MTLHSSYDYIITGAGCAGLSLVAHLIHTGQAAGKKILVIDEQDKNEQDRTWCFWETEPGLFEDIVYRQWDELWFHGQEYSRLLTIDPYRYKMIRGIDFYDYCRQLILQCPDIEWIKARVDRVQNAGGRAEVILAAKKVQADYVFNSILFSKPELNNRELLLYQHFKGWTVKMDKPVFEAGQATLMDFRTGQQHGTAFVYVMPLSATEALVEYTLFTPQLLQQEAYDQAIKEYLHTHYPGVPYQVGGSEYGIIPMTNYRFPPADGRLVHIGTAGGDTKASSGYTFQFIQKRCAAIAKALKENNYHLLEAGSQQRKFRFYDSVLLNVLYKKRMPGATVFSRLFRKNDPARILRFLDNSSSLADDIRVIRSLPALPFLKAAVQQWR